MDNELEGIIDFYKYLKYPKCIESGLYCKVHRVEVENILNQNSKMKHA